MALRVLAVLGVGLVDPATPIAAADDAGLTRGDGCFEGCRLVVGADGIGRVDKLDAHLDRMARSAAALELPFDRAAWTQLVESAISAWSAPGEAAVKLVLTRGRPGAGPTGFLTVSDLPAQYARQRREGLRVVTLGRGTCAEAFLDAPWLLGGVKTLSYAVNLAALREAERRGADDVIFLSSDGAVLESALSSVVWSVGRTLFTTPTGGSGILGGTTQQLLFDRAAHAGWAVEVQRTTLPELQAAELIWLVGSVRGPVDVVALDGVHRTRVPAVDDEVRRLAGFPPASSAC